MLRVPLPRSVACPTHPSRTKDQFSLGLRLAFALATLPQELGTSPGFIFLDEPLSSFDTQRTQALVDLITGDGVIARSFAQVFVVSHSRSVDPRQFGYHVRMDGGRVAESDLPWAGDGHAVVAPLEPAPVGQVTTPAPVWLESQLHDSGSGVSGVVMS